MLVQTAATHKPTYVTVAPLNIHAGLYSALSTDGSTWYAVDVKARTCTCPAGAHGFVNCRQGCCKHVVAARTVARGLASLSGQDRARALRLQNIRVNVSAVSVEALDVPLHRVVALPVAA